MDNEPCWNTIVAQQTIISLSDDPRQFHQDPMVALLNQAHRAKTGQGDVGMLTVPSRQRPCTFAESPNPT